jgi:DNA-binding response OmpR family regulator
MATTALQVKEMAESLPHAAGTARKREECVLLIEDSEDAMLLVRYALREYGQGKYRLEWAKCLSEGLSMMLKGGVDVVLLDLGLPESSGALSYAWVREAAPDVPVVVLTGDTREETELSVFSSGVEDYLVKDQVSGSLLVSTIRDALYKGEVGQERKTRKIQSAQPYNWKPQR